MMKKTATPTTPTQDPIEVRLGEARARIVELERRNERLEKQHGNFQRFIESALKLIAHELVNE